MSARVLFVDDETALLDMLRRQLRIRGQGIEARFASGVDEAVAVLESWEPEVVVSDLRMPGRDGTSFLAEVAQRWPACARLILTGQYDSSRILDYARVAHQVLLKPVSVDDLLGTTLGLAALRRVLTEPALARITGRLRSLPVLPEVYVRMRRALKSETSSLDELGRIIAQDPALSATVLRLCNSAFMGMARQVACPVEAARILGVENIKAMVLYHELFRSLDPGQEKNFGLESLRRHSQRTAGLARCIARHEEGDKSQVETCFLAGLLHDLGQLVFIENFPEEYRKILRDVGSHARELRLVEAERRAFGASHAEVGAFLMGLWGLSPDAALAVAHHHDPSRSDDVGFGPLAATHAACALEWESFNGADADEILVDTDWLDEVGCLERLETWREACARDDEETENT